MNQSTSNHLTTIGPKESELYKCVHCGFCLQACPTYLETGLETESPRGRIALMKAFNEKRILPNESTIRHWDLCIQCRACEIACPSGVPYGRLIESTMEQVRSIRNTSLISRIMSSILLRWILPHHQRLRLLTTALRTYQRSGLQRVVRKTRILKLIPGNISELERSLPTIPKSYFYAKGQIVPARNLLRAKVALLSGCIMPLVNGPQMESVVRILSYNGCEVLMPEYQVCCGAINSHLGDLRSAKDLARKNIDVFLESEVEAIVVASAGCGSRMKEYTHLLEHDPAYSSRAALFSSMVKDIHEFLVELPFERPTKELAYRVTYQDSCHLSNAQRITDQPRDILRSIPGIELIELPESAVCCGAGGTYTITERDFSMRVLDSKMLSVRETNANVIATANPGCLLQLQYGVDKENLPIRVCYVTDLLEEAYRSQKDYA